MSYDNCKFLMFEPRDDGAYELTQSETKDLIYETWGMYGVTLLEADFMEPVYGRFVFPGNVVFSYGGKCYGTDFARLWREYTYEIENGD